MKTISSRCCRDIPTPKSPTRTKSPDKAPVHTARKIKDPQRLTFQKYNEYTEQQAAWKLA
jgi:hypothetical protein